MNFSDSPLPDERRVWVSGSSRNGTRSRAKFYRTLAHEIGHVFLDWERAGQHATSGRDADDLGTRAAAAECGGGRWSRNLHGQRVPPG
jgi:hypothetical protein